MSGFPQNFEYLCRQFELGDQKQIAKTFGLARETISRLRSGIRNPTEQHLQVFSRLFRISPNALLLDHDKFLDTIDIRRRNPGPSMASIRTISLNSNRFEDVFKKYEGSYKVYHLQLDKSKVVVSLLNVKYLADEGIIVEYINPHVDVAGHQSNYEYRGYLYPLAGFMYVVCEQFQSEYEILTMLLHDNPDPKPRVLKGLVTGIGVIEGSNYIAARPIILARQRNKLKNEHETLDGNIGHLPIGEIPQYIRNLLSTEEITMKV